MFRNYHENKSCDGSWITASVITTCVVLSLIALVGFCNSYWYLYRMKKYMAFPLTLYYVTCQFTLLTGIARTIMISILPHSYIWLHICNLEAFGMLCVGVSQVVTLLELTFKTK